MLVTSALSPAALRARSARMLKLATTLIGSAFAAKARTVIRAAKRIRIRDSRAESRTRYDSAYSRLGLRLLRCRSLRYSHEVLRANPFPESRLHVRRPEF